MPPKIIGPYRIEGVLGRGGISTVYRAFDRRSSDEVAVKLLSSGPALEPTTARRLVREFEALAELSHPNVVRVFDAGVFQGYPYLVMELIEGLDLRRYLSVDLDDTPKASLFHPDDPSDAAYDPSMDEEDEPGLVPGGFDLGSLLEEPDTDSLGVTPMRSGRKALHEYARQTAEPETDCELDSLEAEELSSSSSMEQVPAEQLHEPAVAAALPDGALDQLNRPERVGRLKDSLLQICEALSYIHGHGLVHRDLKPGNIMVDDDRRVRLMDFGLAKHLAEESTVTAAGKVVGTYRYMAPEQAMGERVDGRADLYSLGVLVYELLCGRPPYDGRTPMELWQSVLDHEPASLFEMNPDADEALARICQRLLRKDPGERFQTAEEVFELLMAG